MADEKLLMDVRNVVDIPGMQKILDGFDTTKPPSEDQIHRQIIAFIDAEESRRLFDPATYRRGSNVVIAKDSEKIRQEFRDKYWKAAKNDDGSIKHYTLGEEALKKTPEAIAVIQREMKRYNETIDPISGMTYGAYIARARGLIKAGKTLTDDELKFVKEFSARVKDKPSSFLLDFGKSDKRTAPEDKQFRHLPGDKFTDSPVFTQWLGYGGGEDLECFEGLSRAIGDYENHRQEMKRTKPGVPIPGFSVQDTHGVLFDYIARADWKSEKRDGKDVMTATLHYPRGMFAPTPFRDMAKARGLSSFTLEFPKRGVTLRQMTPIDPPPSAWQPEITVSREEYERILSPVINRPLQVLKAGPNDFDAQSKTYTIGVLEEIGVAKEKSILAQLPGLLQREKIKIAATEPGGLELRIHSVDYEKEGTKEVLNRFEDLLLGGYKDRQFGEYIVRSAGLLPQQEAEKRTKELLDELKRKQIQYTAKNETFFIISADEYAKIQKILDGMDKPAGAAPAPVPPQTSLPAPGDMPVAALEAVRGLGIRVPDAEGTQAALPWLKSLTGKLAPLAAA